jgi:hypothetical protein
MADDSDFPMFYGEINGQDDFFVIPAEAGIGQVSGIMRFPLSRE